MSSRTRVFATILAFALVPGIASTATAAEPTPADMVDALNGVFGKHPHTRAGHAKGYCVTGSFTPSPEAPSLSKGRNSSRLCRS